ncbi:hypothetical protein E2C01_046291 [Portunus trituberculatus]|uniref:Uncharacterized protein n=1 Tax=Portunus trituberculatus TaxID=210409 RepID=A0A5B7G5B0_PORTR|nr:hypothetical protein [Portunus trituberculatus]
MEGVDSARGKHFVSTAINSHARPPSLPLMPLLPPYLFSHLPTHPASRSSPPFTSPFSQHEQLKGELQHLKCNTWKCRAPFRPPEILPSVALFIQAQVKSNQERVDV